MGRAHPQAQFEDRVGSRSRERNAALQNVDEVLLMVGDAAAGSAEREAGPQDHRIARARRECQAVFDVVHQLRLRRFQANAPHGVLEQQPVLGLLDGV